MDAHLTEPNPDLARMIRNTPDGMAHWAGSGPEGKTCKTCAHYGAVFPREGTTKYQDRCKLYQQRAGGRVGGKIPSATAACKYFSAVTD